MRNPVPLYPGRVNDQTLDRAPCACSRSADGVVFFVEALGLFLDPVLDYGDCHGAFLPVLDTVFPSVPAGRAVGQARGVGVPVDPREVADHEADLRPQIVVVTPEDPFPEPHRAVRACSGERAPVRAEGDAIDLGGVARRPSWTCVRTLQSRTVLSALPLANVLPAARAARSGVRVATERPAELHGRVFTSHSRTSAFALPVASMLPSLLNAMLDTGLLSRWRWPRGAWVRAPHRRTVPSAPAVARTCPSGLNDADSVEPTKPGDLPMRTEAPEQRRACVLSAGGDRASVRAEGDEPVRVDLERLTDLRMRVQIPQPHRSVVPSSD